MLPPYWSLGFHLCRWGYNSIENLTEIIQVSFMLELFKNELIDFIFAFSFAINREIMMLNFLSMFNGQISM